MVLALLLPSFKVWAIVSVTLNIVSQLFHIISWAVVSVQRYLYIVKKEWLLEKYPEPTKIKVTVFYTLNVMDKI